MFRARLAKANIEGFKRKLSLAKERKKHLESYLKSLGEKYSQGKISYSQYTETIYKKTDGRNLKEWIEHYDSYSKNCEKLIKQQKKKIIAKKISVMLLFSVFIFILLGSFFRISLPTISEIQPTLIGFFVQEQKQEFSETLNLQFTNSASYEWTPENFGKLISVKLSGSIEGDSIIKIYLDDKLILNSDNLDSKTKSITGQTISGESQGKGIFEFLRKIFSFLGIIGKAVEEEPAKEPSETTAEETTTTESYSETQEAPQEVSQPSPEQQEPLPSETQEPTQETLPEEIPTPEEETPTNESYSETQEEAPTNVSQPSPEQQEPLPSEIPEEIPKEKPKKEIKFKDICEETCDLESLNLNKTSYTLRIEITGENTTLFLDEIKYEIIKALEEIPEEIPENITEIPKENITLPEINITNVTQAPQLLKNIPNIEIQKNTFTTIDITEYFSNAEQFFLLQTLNITTTIYDHVIELKPDRDFLGNRTLKIIVTNDFGKAESNFFNITVAELKTPTLLKNIPDITIQKNSQTEINLSDYFSNAEEFYFLQTKNISTTIYDHIIKLVPDKEFVGTRQSKIIASNSFGDVESNLFNIIVSENITLPINITEINITLENVTITTTQFQAVLGQPVKWKKHISPEEIGILKLPLPEEATNISVSKIKDNQELAASATITGLVISGEREGGIFNFFKRIFSALTGRVTEEIPKEIEVDVEIDDDKAEYEVEYETPAPYALEEELENGKQVTIVGPDSVHYENVLVFANLSESLNLKDPSIAKIYWVENGSYVPVEKIQDTDSNGIYDYVEWLVPNLSRQTFRIIIKISKAEHLDENRTFISDIYNESRALDDIWSETIPSGHYIRTAFELNLTNGDDITLFPRVVSGNPKIEVYEKDKNELLAEFSSLTSEQYNKAVLTNLKQEQNVFDLKILNGDVQIDHIFDLRLNIRNSKLQRIGNYTIIKRPDKKIDIIIENGINKIEIRGIDPKEIKKPELEVSLDFLEETILNPRDNSNITSKTPTSIFAFENLSIENATIRLEKVQGIDSISKCDDWNFTTWQCEGGWTPTNTEFIQTDTYIEFTVENFSGWVGTSYTYDDFEITQSPNYCITVMETNWTASICDPGAGNFTLTTSQKFLDSQSGNVTRLKASAGNEEVNVYDSYIGATKSLIYSRVYFKTDCNARPNVSNGLWHISGLGDGTADRVLSAGINTDGTLGCLYNISGQVGQCGNNQTISCGQWHTIELYWRSGTPTTDRAIMCWLDSAKFCSANNTGITANIGYVSIGSTKDSDNSSNGTIFFDEYRSSDKYIGVYPNISNLKEKADAIHPNISQQLNATINDSDGNLQSVWIAVEQCAPACSLPVNYTVTTNVSNEYYFTIDEENYSEDALFNYNWYANDSNGQYLNLSGSFRTANFTLSNCTNITAPGIYTLINDIPNSPIQNCIVINSSNVELNCQGYLIDGKDTANTYGVFSDGASDAANIRVNNTIKNCRLTDWNQGIFFDFTNNSVIDKVNISSSARGIYFGNSDDDTINNTNSSFNTINGYYSINGDKNKIMNSHFSSNTQTAVRMQRERYAQIINNTISKTVGGYEGIFCSDTMTQCEYNIFANNTIKENTIGIGSSNYGFYYTNFTNNTIINNSRGFSINNLFVSNRIWNNLMNNTANVVNTTSTTTNLFNTTKTSGTNIIGGSWIGGNYWGYPNGTGFSDTCTDTDQDGICDTNYTINSGFIDFLPLTYPGADSVAPNLTIVYPSNNTNWSDVNLDVNYTVADVNLQSCWYSNDTYLVNISLDPPPLPCRLNITDVVWSEAKHNVTVWANDSAGNENSSRVSFTIDITGPNLNTEGQNETEINLNEWFCVNITATDNFTKVDTVYAHIFNTTYEVNYTMTDTGSTSCDVASGDNIYGANIQGTAVGLWKYRKVYANDSVNNLNTYDFTDLTISVNAGANNAPNITRVFNESMTDVSNGLNQGPFSTSVIINFTAYDQDGDLNHTTATINFSKSGEKTRTNSSCYKFEGDATLANYTCNLTMWWWDGAGAWAITAFILDNATNPTTNSSMNFSVGATTAFEMSPSTLTWPGISPGAVNQVSDNDPIVLNNTGNQPIGISTGNISVNATNLRGETTSSLALWAGNFSVAIVTGQVLPDPPDECTFGPRMVPGNFTNITDSVLNKGNYTINNGTAQEQLYFCLNIAGSELTNQQYSTANEGTWTIRVLLVAVIPARRRKKNKTKQIIGELSIPSTIFSEKLSVLESISKYLKENLGFHYSEIAELLNRDERTIWTSYNRAMRKQKEILETKEARVFLPVSIFKNRNLTTLEAIVVYLKEKGMKFSEIAKLLNRDQRNIWSIYSKAMKKIRDKAR